MSPSATILIVDDEPDVREVLEEYFVAHGYATHSAASASSARALAAAHPIDLALVDIHMPGEDGLSLARHLRERHARIAIVMLTSAATVVDRIVGLEMGADDYVPKPFDPRELLARVKSVLRRTSAARRADIGAERVRIGRCVLDLGAHRLTDEQGGEVSMSSLEFDLLKALAEQPNRALSRERIMNLSQSRDRDPFDRSVDLRVMRLRKKVEPDPEHPRYIRTIRNEGYIFVPDERKSVVGGLRTVRSIWFLACIALVITLVGCTRAPETALRIGTNVWIGSEPLYLARELGALNPAEVQLVEYPSASEVLRAFRNEAIDGMVISMDELLGLAVDGLEPRAVLVVDVSHGADVVVGRTGMKTMKDLKGRSVAVESGALGAFVLSRALALNGMQASDVNVVHLESNEQPRAFEKGQVDGAVTFDPYRTQLLRAGATTVFDSTRIPGEIVDLVAVRATVLQRKPKAVQALLAGWFSALDYMQRDPNEAARRMGIRHQSTGEQFLEAQRGLHIPSRVENLKMLSGPTPELVTSGRRLMTLMIESKLLRAAVDIEAVLAPQPLASMVQ